MDFDAFLADAELCRKSIRKIEHKERNALIALEASSFYDAKAVAEAKAAVVAAAIAVAAAAKAVAEAEESKKTNVLEWGEEADECFASFPLPDDATIAAYIAEIEAEMRQKKVIRQFRTTT